MGRACRPILRGVKGIRYAVRNFTALSVKEHLRSQIEEAGSDAELTPKEAELVRFAIARSDRLGELADRSPTTT
jgi:DNA-binding FrmR family transcriptional regulator